MISFFSTIQVSCTKPLGAPASLPAETAYSLRCLFNDYARVEPVSWLKKLGCNGCLVTSMVVFGSPKRW